MGELRGDQPSASTGQILPTRVRSKDLRSRLGEARRNGQLLGATMVNLAPPRPDRWGCFGRSTVVPPVRVFNPECITIGDGVLVYEHVWFAVVRPFADLVPRLVIEDHVRIGRGCAFAVAGEMIIGSGALLDDFVLLADTFHPFEEEDRLPASVRPDPVQIGEGAVLRSHVVVLPGVTVGAGACVEHHSVVSNDVPPGATVAGYPARRVVR